jgi:hypothetical protein
MESIDVEIELKLTELKIVGNHYNEVVLAMRYSTGGAMAHIESRA